MNSVFIPYIPAGMTIHDLKNALEDHYDTDLAGIDRVHTPRGYMFFAHFVTDLWIFDVAAIDATSQYKLITGTGQLFYVRRNTGKLDVLDPAVQQILFYDGKTYMCNAQIMYMLVDGEWSEVGLPPEVVGIYIERQFTPSITRNLAQEFALVVV